MTILEMDFFVIGVVKKGSRGFPSFPRWIPCNPSAPSGDSCCQNALEPQDLYNSLDRFSACVTLVYNTWSYQPCLYCTTVGPARATRFSHIANLAVVLEEHVWRWRGYYTASLQLHKWWHWILTFILDSSLFNTYVLYSVDVESLDLPQYTWQLWYFNLGRSLVAPMAFVCPNVPRGRFRTLGCYGFQHRERHGSLRRRCIVCKPHTCQFFLGYGGRFVYLALYYLKMHMQPKYALVALGVWWCVSKPPLPNW